MTKKRLFKIENISDNFGVQRFRLPFCTTFFKSFGIKGIFSYIKTFISLIETKNYYFMFFEFSRMNCIKILTVK